MSGLPYGTNAKNRCTYVNSANRSKIYNDDEFQPWFQEIMILNRICVITDSCLGVAFDYVNELYNLWLKQPPGTMFIDTAVQCSAHTILQRKCASEILYMGSVKRSSGASKEADINKMESLLDQLDLFVSHDPVAMTLDKFW